MKRIVNCLLAGVCCFLLSGCYKRVSENGNTTISFESWVPLLIAVGGLFAVPIGLLLFTKKQKFWGIVLIILGPLAAIALAPGMFQDHVVVSKDHFFSRHGFWWSPITHEVKYDDLNRVHVTVEEKTGRRGRKSYSYFFECSFKNGKQERVPLGDLMKEALPDIVHGFREHGIRVDVPDNMPS